MDYKGSAISTGSINSDSENLIFKQQPSTHPNDNVTNIIYTPRLNKEKLSEVVSRNDEAINGKTLKSSGMWMFAIIGGVLLAGIIVLLIVLTIRKRK